MAKDNYHHGDLKTELIKKGLNILNEEGFDAFSLRKVAKACNVSQTAPYRHYKDKEELITAITLTALQAFNESLEQAVANQVTDPKRQLRDLGIAYVRFFVENPEYLKLLFLSDLKLGMAETGKKHCEDKQGHPFDVLVQTVRRYKAHYAEEKRSEEELLMYCWGLVHGIAVLIVNNEIPFKSDYMQLAKAIIESERFL